MDHIDVDVDSALLVLNIFALLYDLHVRVQPAQVDHLPR